MAQFDVHRFAPRGAGFTMVVDVQSGLLDGLATWVVVPLYPLKAKDRPIHRLNPLVQIDGKPHYLAVQEMTALHSDDRRGPIAVISLRRTLRTFMFCRFSREFV